MANKALYDYYNRPMQSIGDNNMIGGFIQNLIASTPLPIYDTVSRGDIVIAGNYYIYDFDLIECTETGYIGIENKDPLYPSDNLAPSNILYPSDGIQGAKYNIVSHFDFGRYYPKITYRYFPKNSYYDSATHFHLGRYLRCIRDIYGVNYMPFYNCNNQVYLNRLSDYYQGANLYAIPIKFNTDYTLSYQSSHYIKLKPILYGAKPIEFEGYDDIITYQQTWKELAKTTTVSGTDYLNYQKFRINTTNPVFYRHQAFLYLLISSEQPIQSLSVVEGNYTSTPKITIGNSGEAEEEFVFDIVKQPILLSDKNRDKTYAFSNRLFEGLLHHTINSQDDIYWDIARVQKKLGITPDGIWSGAIQERAFKGYTSAQNQILNPQFNQYDINGNIDKDVEYWLFGNNISSKEEL